MTNASPKQMALLKKIYYKSELLGFESYDIFDDINIPLVSQDDAQTLIDRKLNNRPDDLMDDAKQIIKKIESQI